VEAGERAVVAGESAVVAGESAVAGEARWRGRRGAAACGEYVAWPPAGRTIHGRRWGTGAAAFEQGSGSGRTAGGW
jgi:hypothetical protein